MFNMTHIEYNFFGRDPRFVSYSTQLLPLTDDGREAAKKLQKIKLFDQYTMSKAFDKIPKDFDIEDGHMTLVMKSDLHRDRTTLMQTLKPVDVNNVKMNRLEETQRYYDTLFNFEVEREHFYQTFYKTDAPLQKYSGAFFQSAVSCAYQSILIYKAAATENREDIMQQASNTLGAIYAVSDEAELYGMNLTHILYAKEPPHDVFNPARWVDDLHLPNPTIRPHAINL